MPPSPSAATATAPSVTAQLGAAVHQNGAQTTTGLLERLFSQLFHGLVYAQIWEDPVVDMTALELAPGEDIICIASGGCNAMSYLTARPGSLTAVDLSPAHVALLRLKLAAARVLSQEEFESFFAGADSAANLALYDSCIAPLLDRTSRRYWEGRAGLRRRISIFARGAYRFGLLGRFIGASHLVARLGGVDFAPLLRARTLGAQRDYFDRELAPLFEKPAVQWLARRRAALFGLGIPPAQYDKLARDGGGDVLPVLRERLRKLVCDFPIDQNYFAWQAFARHYKQEGPRALPPYLDPAAFATVSRMATRVAALNRSMTDVLAVRAAASLDAYVLLDAQDWMTDDQLGALWQEITRTARPGARVIFRTGGADDILPGRVAPALLGRWRYDAPASRAGFDADRSAIYGGFHLYRFEG